MLPNLKVQRIANPAGFLWKYSYLKKYKWCDTSKAPTRWKLVIPINQPKYRQVWKSPAYSMKEKPVCIEDTGLWSSWSSKNMRRNAQRVDFVTTCSYLVAISGYPLAVMRMLGIWLYTQSSASRWKMACWNNPVFHPYFATTLAKLQYILHK